MVAPFPDRSVTEVSAGYDASVSERWPDPVEQRDRARVTAPETSWALRDLTRAAAEVDHALASRMRLRAMDYAALGHVTNEPGTLGPVELSARLGISSGSATELVDRLERSGHVERRRHPDDRRRLTLHPTDRAISGVLGELAPLFSALDALAGELDPDGQAVVAGYLRAAAQRMRAFAATTEEPRRH